MKTGSPALACQRETTCHWQRKLTDTDLEFSFWFSVAVLTYLFSGFVSTATRLV